MLASIEAPPECFSEYSSKQRVLLYSGVSSQHSKRIQQYHSISRKVNQVSSLLRIPLPFLDVVECKNFDSYIEALESPSVKAVAINAHEKDQFSKYVQCWAKIFHPDVNILFI
jgi:hypothetical protein